MKEYKKVGEEEYETYDDLLRILNVYAVDGWEVVCTLGEYNHTVLLARTGKFPPQEATSASDDHST